MTVERSKRRSYFLSLVFITKCFTKNLLLLGNLFWKTYIWKSFKRELRIIPKFMPWCVSISNKTCSDRKFTWKTHASGTTHVDTRVYDFTRFNPPYFSKMVDRSDVRINYKVHDLFVKMIMLSKIIDISRWRESWFKNKRICLPSRVVFGWGVVHKDHEFDHILPNLFRNQCMPSTKPAIWK